MATRILLTLSAAVAVAARASDAPGVVAPSSTMPSSRSAVHGDRKIVRRRWGWGKKKALPEAAFQMTDLTFELPTEEYALGKPYLIQFKGKGDDYCAQMEPLKEQLKEELGVNIRCFEVWYDSKNLELMQRLDRGRCGGVPFFYNKRSRRYICGATTYANLRAWALCQPCEPIAPPPNLNENNPPPQNAVQRVFGQVKKMAQEKMQRGGGDEGEADEEDEEDEDED